MAQPRPGPSHLLAQKAIQMVESNPNFFVPLPPVEDEVVVLPPPEVSKPEVFPWREYKSEIVPFPKYDTHRVIIRRILPGKSDTVIKFSKFDLEETASNIRTILTRLRYNEREVEAEIQHQGFFKMKDPAFWNKNFCLLTNLGEIYVRPAKVGRYWQICIGQPRTNNGKIKVDYFPIGSGFARRFASHLDMLHTKVFIADAEMFLKEDCKIESNDEFDFDDN